MDILQSMNKHIQSYINPKETAVNNITEEEVTAKLVRYYIPYRLRSKLPQCSLIGLPREYLIPPKHASELQAFLAKRCFEMENDNEQFFNGMSTELAFNAENIRSKFLLVANEVIIDGVNWGRVVSLFTFCGVLSHSFIEQQRPELVVEIISLLIEFINVHIISWIKRNGGWDGLSRTLSNRKNTTWTNALMLGGIWATTYLLLSGR